jgi:serine protease inhibitor
MNNQLAFNNFASKDSNLVFSPSDLESILLMLDDALPDKLGVQLAEKLALENSPISSAVDQSQALWVPNTFKVRAELPFRKKTDLFGLPEKTASAKQMVNAWAEDKTHGLITELVSKEQLDQNDPGLLMTSVVFFEALWAQPFEHEDSINFHNLAGQETGEVKAMQKTSLFSYLQKENYQAVKLDYSDSQAEMILVLPDQDAFEVVASRWLDDLQTEKDFEPVKISFSVPQIDLSFENDIAEFLEFSGLEEVLHNTDFKKLVDQPMTFSRAVQKARIQMTPEGTRAAAASFVGLRAGSAFELPKEICF